MTNFIKKTGDSPAACSQSGGCLGAMAPKTVSYRDKLEFALELAERHLAMAEARLAEVQRREEGFWNFMSAENLWGLSARLTDDGRPFSAMELDALYEYRSELRTIIEGIRSLIKSEEAGVEPRESGPLVGALLSSPYAAALASEPNPESLARITNGAARFAKGLGLPRLASAIADDVAGQFSDACSKEILRSGLTGWFTRNIGWTARDLGNSLASVDSVLFMAAGGAVGRMFGMTGIGQQLGLSFHVWSTALRSASSASHLVRYVPKLSGFIFGILPGSQLWRLAPSAGKLAHVGAAAVNLGWEGAKFAAAAEIAGRTMGDDARWWTERLFLFSAAAHASYSPIWRSELATRIASGEKHAFYDALARAEYVDSNWTPILRDLEQRTGANGMRFELRKSFFRTEFERMATTSGKPYFNPVEDGLAQLAKLADDYPNVVPASLLGETKASLMTVCDTDKASRVVERALAVANRYIRKEANRLAKSRMLTPREIDVAALKKATKESSTAAEAAGFKKTTQPQFEAQEPTEPIAPKRRLRKAQIANSPENKKTGSAPSKGKKGASASTDGKRAKLEDAKVQILEAKISAPPSALDTAEIASITGNRVSVVNGAADGLAEFYRGAGPRQRMAFWGVVKKLATGEHVGKKTFKGEQLYSDGVVWHYHPMRALRIFYSICDDGIRIFKVEKSASMRTGSTKWR